jgi:hypothetical protein
VLEKFGDGRVFLLRLTEALRYYDEKGEPQDLRAGQNLFLRTDQMVNPPPEVFASPKTLAEHERQYGTFGGDFAHRLTKFLTEYNPKQYPADLATGDNNDARASVPPPLIGQGGRTQPGWLFRFLLNPQPVRKMAVLRMPRFNLSREEADALVAYFTAVERLTNPRFEVNPGQAVIPQKADLGEPYWEQRTQEYVRYLKNNKVKDGDRTLYEQRVEDLRPIWNLIAKDLQQELDQAKSRLKDVEALFESAAKDEKAALEALGKGKDDAEKAKLAAQLKAKADAKLDVEKTVGTWKDRVGKLEEVIKNTTVEKQKERWESQEAYVVDAFRLLGSPGGACIKCHQVGSRAPSDPKQQGPPLNLAHSRLRPDWITHWVAKPDRMVTYPSPMPAYFPKDQPGQFQELFAGQPMEQIRALSDVLMIYDRALEMPVNRYVLYPVATKQDEKKDEKKGGKK